MDAIDAFDLDRGVKFETYCTQRIRGAIFDELRAMDWVPRLVRSRTAKVEKARRSIEMESGQKATEQEICKKLDVDKNEFGKLSRDSKPVGVVSLNRKWFETDSSKDVREIDVVKDTRQENPVTQLQRRPQAPVDQRPLPSRASHHHPLLLRGDDDEGDRGDLGSVRVAGEPDALVDPRSTQGADAAPKQGILIQRSTFQRTRACPSARPYSFSCLDLVNQPNSMPWASGRSSPQLMVHVCRRM